MRPKRLANVWKKNPVYFITSNVKERRAVLNTNKVYCVLRGEWRTALERHSWAVGRFVVMPDHVHFFCATLESKKSLSEFVGAWKEWTSKRIRRELGMRSFEWQEGFFDHLIRGDESRSEKWEYVRANPVRAGLVESPENWPFMGAVDFE